MRGRVWRPGEEAELLALLPAVGGEERLEAVRLLTRWAPSGGGARHR